MSSPAPTPAPTPPAAPPRRLSRGRKWLFRLAAVVLGPALVLGLLELGLRIGGYGRSTAFFLDGSKAEAPGTVIDNPQFGRWAFPRGYERTPAPVPFVMPKEKPAGTCRVFVLGESAVMGFPDPSVSAARVLEVLLKARYPS